MAYLRVRRQRTGGNNWRSGEVRLLVHWLRLGSPSRFTVGFQDSFGYDSMYIGDPRLWGVDITYRF